MTACGNIAAPISSIAMIDSASGVFDDAAKTAARPTPAASSRRRGSAISGASSRRTRALGDPLQEQKPGAVTQTFQSAGLIGLRIGVHQCP